MPILKITGILLAMLLLVLSSSAVADQQVIRITGIPDENPTELQRKYKPLVAYLEKKLGKKIKYVPVINYNSAVAALAAKKVDFAWLGGFTHVQARIITGAQPVVMRKIDRQFKSVIIAHHSAGIKTPADLKGKTFAFGSKSSTSGHLMPRHFLSTRFNINPDKSFKTKPVYSGAHDATAMIVQSGRVQAGALNQEVWKRLVKTNKVDTSKVAVIWTTPAYVDYVWTARKGLDPALVSKFRSAFLTLDPLRPAHKAVLSLQGAKGFVTGHAKDFNAIEKVGYKTGLLRK